MITREVVQKITTSKIDNDPKYIETFRMRSLGEYHYYDINESVYLEIWEGKGFEFTVYGDMNDDTICKYKSIVAGISYQAEINDFQLKDIPEFVEYCRKVVSSVCKKIA